MTYGTQCSRCGREDCAWQREGSCDGEWRNRMARDKAWMADKDIIAELDADRLEGEEVIQRLLNAGYSKEDLIAAINKIVTPE